jgi:hypothetical protein
MIKPRESFSFACSESMRDWENAEPRHKQVKINRVIFFMAAVL